MNAADGSNVTRLTNDPGVDTYPSFSPDGKRILFTSNCVGNDEIYTIDAATGGDLKRLTNNSGNDVEPMFSPDGGRIVFASFRLGFREIFIMDQEGYLAGGIPRQLTDLNSQFVSDRRPVFSPDGKRIAFIRTSTGGSTIRIIDALDGGNETPLFGPAPALKHVASLSWASTSAVAGINTQGILKVNGTAGNDTIQLSGGPLSITVTRNGEVEQFLTEDVTSIQVFGGDGKDAVLAGAGTPAFYASGDAGDDTLVGGDGNDTLTAGGGRNTLFGGNGDDRLNGSSGRDFLCGDGGNDRIYGNAGNDYIVGGGNVDRCWAGEGDDQISGNGQNDKLYGEGGNDFILGGDGNDICYGGLGIDTLNGGKGSDFADDDDADLRIQIESVA